MESFFSSAFEALFKYRPLIYQKGDFTFGILGRQAWEIGIATVVVAAIVLWFYTRARGRTSIVDRSVLVAIRVAAFAIVLFCLLKPRLEVKRIIPQQSYVAVLIDDSRSMRVADDKDRPRTAFVNESFGPDAKLASTLGQRFKLRYFRFSSDIERIKGVGDLGYTGTKTKLGDAMDQVRQDMSGVPLAGVVVVSDGADNSPNGMTSSLLPMKASGVPVYTVGVGKDRLERDIQVSRVETPRSVLKGSSLVVDVVVSQTGYAGRKDTLNVEDAGRIIEKQEITMPPDGEAATVRVHFTAKETGARHFKFSITPKKDEVVTLNNEQEAIIEVHNRREKILYFEGEPRFELKFIRRAVADDPNLQVVGLQRTAEKKFLRLDVDSAGELAAGFPTTRDELFKYRALILGSVEASFFSHDQLQMLDDFVNKRGGGLLAIGGRHSFGEGGYAGTPLGNVLPVVLETPDNKREYFAELKVTPTRAGMTHASMQLADNQKASEERWKTLPPLTTANALYRAKPGATTLLTGAPEGGIEHVVLAYQRYGRGTAFALPVQDSWLWQMHADIPLEDQTHERFWRQLLRWLVSDVPMAVTLAASADLVEPGERLSLTAEVSDSSYLQVNDAQVTATIVPPSGELYTVPLEWSGARDGEYKSNVVLREQGMHEIRVDTKRGDVSLGRDVVHVNAAPSNAEFFDAHLNSTTLKRMAEETGGRYYTPETVSTLADDISYTGRGDTVTERMDLWDMPILFVLLVLLIGSEWVYRRVRGLA